MVPVEAASRVQGSLTPVAWRLVVVDKLGEPIPRAAVMASGGLERVGATDEMGECSIPLGIAEVVADAVGHLPGVARNEGGDLARLILQDAWVLRGVVVDQDGQRLSGAAVRIGVHGGVDARLSVDDGAVGAEQAGAAAAGTTTSRLLEVRSDGSVTRTLEAWSSEDGTFQIRGVPRGRHVMTCLKHGYLVDGAAGSADAQAVQVDVDGQSVECRLRRVYVAVCEFVVSTNWPANAALSLTKRARSAPPGLRFVAEAPLAWQAASLEKALRPGIPHSRYFALAQDGSRLMGLVPGSLAVGVWKQATREEPLHFVPLDRFASDDIRTINITVTEEPRTFVATSPLALSIMSVEPRGFGFDPESRDGGDQLFHLPDGKYHVTAAIPLLLRSNRREEIAIHDGVASPRRITAFDDVGTLFLSAGTGRSQVREGVFMVTCKTKARGSFMVPVDLAAQTLIPCEPGTYEVSFQNQAAERIGAGVFEVVAGETTKCHIELR